MIAYLADLARQLKNFSASLDKQSILIDKPWALIDDNMMQQKLIFRKDKSLILSHNGNVTIGNWEYFAEARSLLINRVTDKILCNEIFINEAVLILKLDGTKQDFFVLANENIIVDLDVYGYLKDLRKNKLNIFTIYLEDGREMEIEPVITVVELVPNSNMKAYFDGVPVKDGVYLQKNSERILEIKDHIIERILYRNKHRTKDGLELLIVSQGNYSLFSGDSVYINEKPAPDGKYKLGFLNNIKVKDGKIV